MFCRNDSEILGLALEALCNITIAETQGHQGSVNFTFSWMFSKL